MQGMKQWSECNAPFSAPISEASPRTMVAASLGMSDLMATLGSAQRGLLVVAELTTPQDVMAALAVSRALGWPVVADALSGTIMLLLLLLQLFVNLAAYVTVSHLISL